MRGTKHFLVGTQLVVCGVYPLNKVYKVVVKDVRNFSVLHLLYSIAFTACVHVSARRGFICWCI